MQVVCDIEANSLSKPTNIWLIVCRDVASGEYYIFREVTSNETEKRRFLAFAQGVSRWIGHNILGYDIPVLNALLGTSIDYSPGYVVDTLILSKLVDYSRPGHSIEQYGKEFGIEKGKFNDFTKYSTEMEAYCVRDVDICQRIYHKYADVVDGTGWQKAVELEHRFQLLVNSLHNNGFAFDTPKAEALLRKVERELAELDGRIHTAFPPKEVLVREFTPKATKHGTISKTSVPRLLHANMANYEVGKLYQQTKQVPFNPSSHKQLIEVLTEAGWQPTDKTQTHIDTERELQRLRYARQESSEVDIEAERVILKGKLEQLKITGWKINENNLATLPETAPSPARTLAKRILLESRRRTLTEWLALVSVDGRIHGKFYGLGAWTHRMAHQNPNTANIPNEVYISTGKPKLLGKEMRSLWRAPKNRLLVGVDAEAIQLRIFAHLIDDEELTNAIVNGKKSDKTDPHSLNQKVFGSFCKTRNAAKHSLYAIFFGGRASKVAQIMACETSEAEEGINNLIQRYPGLARLEKEVFPADARRGYFVGIDGRKVKLPGDTVSQRKHLCMSGYLQNGEKVVMAAATIKFAPKLADYDSFLVDLVHDEWQTETPNKMSIAIAVAKLQADSLKEVGEDLNLKCPLAGSYWNDDKEDYTIGTNWYQTH